MGWRKIAGIVAFAVCAVALAVSLLTFPWKKGDTVEATYVLAVAAGSAALLWGIALLVTKWRRFAMAFAAVATVYAGLLAWAFIRILPA
jgi:hypothetical protein